MMPSAGRPSVRRKDHPFRSAKGRPAGFQQKQEKERRERDAKVRLLLQGGAQSPECE